MSFSKNQWHAVITSSKTSHQTDVLLSWHLRRCRINLFIMSCCHNVFNDVAPSCPWRATITSSMTLRCSWHRAVMISLKTWQHRNMLYLPQCCHYVFEGVALGCLWRRNVMTSSKTSQQVVHDLCYHDVFEDVAPSCSWRLGVVMSGDSDRTEHSRTVASLKFHINEKSIPSKTNKRVTNIQEVFFATHDAQERQKWVVNIV